MKALKALLVVFVTVILLSFGSQAEADGNFTITNVYVEQVKEDIYFNDLYFNVHLSGQETSSENFKLLFTSNNSASWKSELFFESWFIKKGVRFSASQFISKNAFGTYSLNVQAVTTSGITSNLYSFSFNYSKPIPPNWQQAGCDDLWGLNQEALEWDVLIASNANWEVSRQETFASYGCPNKLAWKWKTVKVKQFVWQYTVCADGWHSGSRGRGTCSWHGGVSHEMGYYKTVNSKRPQFYWVY